MEIGPAEADLLINRPESGRSGADPYNRNRPQLGRSGSAYSNKYPSDQWLVGWAVWWGVGINAKQHKTSRNLGKAAGIVAKQLSPTF